MANIPADLQRKQAARWRLLRAVYDETDGRTDRPIPMPLAIERAGLQQDEGLAVLTYLMNEGLLDRNMVMNLLLTHRGVKEVEEVLASGGARGTEHFSVGAINLVQHFNAPVGSVQTGGQGNIAHVSQTVGVASSDVVALTKDLLAKAREHGDEDAIALAERAHAHAQAGTFEKVSVYMESLKTFLELTPWVGAIAKALAGVGM